MMMTNPRVKRKTRKRRKRKIVQRSGQGKFLTKENKSFRVSIRVFLAIKLKFGGFALFMTCLTFIF